MLHNKCCYVKKINKSAAQGSRRVDLMFKQASLKAFTSDFEVCDKDLGIDSVSWATCIESNESKMTCFNKSFRINVLNKCGTKV